MAMSYDQRKSIDVKSRHKYYTQNKAKREEENESNIRNQMRQNSNHEINQPDRDEARIRKSMREKTARTTNNPDYQKYDRARRSGEAKAHDIKRNFDQMVDTAQKSIAKNKPGYDNPTASGSGRGGKMDREWKNHKWVSRNRSDSGKWMYDYGGGTSSGNKPKVHPTEQENAKRNLEITNRKSPSRNTGRELSPFDRVTRDVKANVDRTISDLSKGASDVVSQGKKFLDDLFE